VIVTISLTVVVTLVVSTVYGNKFYESEEGKWIGAGIEGTLWSYAKFYRQFPQSHHQPELYRDVQRLENKILADTADAKNPVSRMLQALHEQDSLPRKVYLVINGNRAYKTTKREANLSRYDYILDGFEKKLTDLIKQSLNAFVPEIVAKEQVLPEQFPTIVISYSAEWGHQYYVRYYGYSKFPYPQDHYVYAIELSVNWELFLGKYSRLKGSTKRYKAPDEPNWEGTNDPEGVIGDIVVDGVLSELKTSVFKGGIGVSH
jgi:hypothetical protein